MGTMNGKEQASATSNETTKQQLTTEESATAPKSPGEPAGEASGTQTTSKMVQEKSVKTPLATSVEKSSHDPEEANPATISQTIEAKLSESPAHSSKTVEILRAIDLEICQSLPENGPRDHGRALEALNRLVTLPAPPTAEELLIAKELLVTLNKIRKYQHDETIRNKAVLHYNRLKNVCLNSNLSQFVIDS